MIRTLDTLELAGTGQPELDSNHTQYTNIVAMGRGTRRANKRKAVCSGGGGDKTSVRISTVASFFFISRVWVSSTSKSMMQTRNCGRKRC